MRVTSTHIYFWGSCFSNFWLAPTSIRVKVSEEPVTFISSEHAFMAYKALEFDDYHAYKKILEAPEARYAKAIGRSVKGYNDDVWNSVRYQYMLNSCHAKFSQNADLKYHLLDTGNKTIVEASPEDTIWGVGLHEDDDRILDEKNWLGENLLGKALMDVRKDISNGCDYFETVMNRLAVKDE